MAEDKKPLMNLDALPHNADWLKGKGPNASMTLEDRQRMRAATAAREAARLRHIEAHPRVYSQPPPIGEGREAMEAWASKFVDEVLDES